MASPFSTAGAARFLTSLAPAYQQQREHILEEPYRQSMLDLSKMTPDEYRTALAEGRINMGQAEAAMGGLQGQEQAQFGQAERALNLRGAEVNLMRSVFGGYSDAYMLMDIMNNDQEAALYNAKAKALEEASARGDEVIDMVAIDERAQEILAEGQAKVESGEAGQLIGSWWNTLRNLVGGIGEGVSDFVDWTGVGPASRSAVSGIGTFFGR
jgi:hypothetical protein